MRSRGRCLTIFVCLLCSAASTAAAGYVKRSGSQLYLDGKPWYFIGADAYWLMERIGDNGRIDSFFSHCSTWGLTAVRLWGFNHNSPYAQGAYSESEMKTFDYIVYSAGQHNVRLIFALGNMWAAYRSAEDFMRMAGDNPAGKDLLDFYRSQSTKDIFKSHIQYFTNRKNTYNGVMYRNDPTIMMWDVFNEPRCPGCTDGGQQSTVHAWIQEMALYLKGVAPNQLVATGTEGYFMDDNNVRWNPGAGAYCEGEDWIAQNKLSGLDVGTVHMYDRQIEHVPPSWREPTFEDNMNWFRKNLEAHVNVAKSLGKPFVMEEFNILSTKFSQAQIAALFQLVYDYLIYNKQTNGPMMGAMFWNAVVGGGVPDYGYNINLDSARPKVTKAEGASDNSTRAGGRRKLTTADAVEPRVSASDVRPNTETLTPFLRGPQRAACAENAAKWWRPLWDEPGQRTVDVKQYMSRTSGKNVLDIMSATAYTLAH